MASVRPAGDDGVTGGMGWGDRLERLFRPRSVAVVGASTNASFVSSILFSLIAYGFQGRIAAVNPRYDRVMLSKLARSMSRCRRSSPSREIAYLRPRDAISDRRR